LKKNSSRSQANQTFYSKTKAGLIIKQSFKGFKKEGESKFDLEVIKASDITIGTKYKIYKHQLLNEAEKSCIFTLGTDIVNKET